MCAACCGPLVSTALSVHCLQAYPGALPPLLVVFVQQLAAYYAPLTRGSDPTCIASAKKLVEESTLAATHALLTSSSDHHIAEGFQLLKNTASKIRITPSESRAQPQPYAIDTTVFSAEVFHEWLLAADVRMHCCTSDG